MAWLILLLFALPSEARNLGQLRSDARIYSSDTGTNAARFRFSNSQVNDFINECQRDAVSLSWPVVKARSFELVAGTTYYSLATDFMAIKRVTWKNRILDEKSPKALDNLKEWETVSGSPVNYFITFSSRTKIGIYPFPADSTSTGTIKYEYFSQATDLSADADVPFEGTSEYLPLHQMLAYCAAAKMSAIEGLSDLVQLYTQLYQLGLARLSEMSQSRPNYNPGASGSRGGP